MTRDILADPPVVKYPHVGQVPRLPSDNLAWREELLQDAKKHHGVVAKFMQMSAEDSLFWVQSFCWLYEPRPQPQVLPFVLWEHQLPVWKEMERWIGVGDVGLEKSRGEGASWMVLMLCLHKWLFTPMFSAGLVSKDESSADDPDDPDSLMWKLDWQLGAGKNFKGRGMLPKWMVPPLTRLVSNHTLRNNKNNSTIVAYAATANVGSGGRKTLFFMDELSKFPRGPDQDAMNSTQYVTDCRFLISTPKGPEGAYFDAMHKESNIVKVVLDWKQNPTRSMGAYKTLIATTNERVIELVDTKFWINRAKEAGSECRTEGDVRRLAKLITDETPNNPFAYRFMLVGPYVKHEQIRSPWYDLQCRRPGATPVGISQELDRDYGGSTSRFFDISMIMRMANQCRDPVTKGEVTVPERFDSVREIEDTRYIKTHGGFLHLWFDPGERNLPPRGRDYVIGLDVAASGSGLASSASVACVIDILTGDQVAEYANGNIEPIRFSEYAACLGYWFKNPSGFPAQLIWEANGPGGAFGNRITQMGYPNVWYRGTTEEYIEKSTKKIGFWTSSKTKQPLLSQFGEAVDSGRCHINSHKCIDEAKYYIHSSGGNIVHVASATTKDPSGASWNHGDRLLAAALAWWVAKDYIVGGSTDAAIPIEAPQNCALSRRRAAKKGESQQDAWVPPSERRVQSKGLFHRR